MDLLNDRLVLVGRSRKFLCACLFRDPCIVNDLDGAAVCCNNRNEDTNVEYEDDPPSRYRATDRID
jgi:hypothetical protein